MNCRRGQKGFQKSSYCLLPIGVRRQLGPQDTHALLLCTRAWLLRLTTSTPILQPGVRGLRQRNHSSLPLSSKIVHPEPSTNARKSNHSKHRSGCNVDHILGSLGHIQKFSAGTPSYLATRTGRSWCATGNLNVIPTPKRA